MNTDRVKLTEEIAAFCKELEGEFELIPRERKTHLGQLSNYISGKIKQRQTANLVVICTHNSRRSHMGQIALAVAAEYFQIRYVQTFSGGTEATAFNIRAVKAFQRLGFGISAKGDQENPIYEVRWEKEMEPYQAFSKKYEEDPNPKEKFAAIMVCSQADEGCPLVSGADFRLSLPFDDPKEFDDTEFESTKYDERARQIGREMLFAVSRVKA